jgi:hypothetical protein
MLSNMALTSLGLLTSLSATEIAREFATESACKTSNTRSTNCSSFMIKINKN